VPPGGAVPPPGGKKSKAPVAIIIGAILGLLVVAAVVALVVVPALTDDDDDEDARPTTTTTQQDDDTTTTEGGDDDTTTTEGGDDEPSGDLPQGQIPGDLESAEFDALGASCQEGDMGACDALWVTTPVGSVAEAYGGSCGGRLDELVNGGCGEEFEGEWDLPDAQAPGDLGSDSDLDELVDECESGDMFACDDLYGDSDSGSDYEAYAITCGGRLPSAAIDELSGGSCDRFYGTANS
jgi:hypothetical protein